MLSSPQTLRNVESIAPCQREKTVNPLLHRIHTARVKISDYKQQARQFYYRVVLSGYVCPDCDESLKMTGVSQCRCVNGHLFDPTTAFQRSPCCGAKLKLKIHHYACSQCGGSVLSRFLFDEAIFNGDYFKEKMRQSRQNREERLQSLKQLLLKARSRELILNSLPELNEVPGLEEDLDRFLGRPDMKPQDEDDEDVFRLEDYRRLILGCVDGCIVLFSAFPRIHANDRLDRARRFLTLTFLWQDREVELIQKGETIAVEGR